MAGKKGNGNQRGFASMDQAKQREIARKGGKAAHQKGTAHEFSSEEARNAGKKGGESVSQDRDHMAEIGRKGGQTVSQDRDHMAEIGRKGGEASRGGNRSGDDSEASQDRRGNREGHS
jgi:general stress protein YciG